jgi:hypothetical protein
MTSLNLEAELTWVNLLGLMDKGEFGMDWLSKDRDYQRCREGMKVHVFHDIEIITPLRKYREYRTMRGGHLYVITG